MDFKTYDTSMKVLRALLSSGKITEAEFKIRADALLDQMGFDSKSK